MPVGRGLIDMVVAFEHAVERGAIDRGGGREAVEAAAAHQRNLVDEHVAFGPQFAGLLATVSEPLLHERDFFLLRIDDGLRQFAHFGIGAVIENDAGHVDRALMVRDHAAQEIEVSVPAELNRHVRMHAVICDLIIANDRVIRQAFGLMLAMSFVLHDCTSSALSTKVVG